MIRRQLPFIAMLMLGAVSVAWGRTEASTTTAPTSTAAATPASAAQATSTPDSDLVKAAKASSGKKKSRLSITDKDVKKTTGGKTPVAASTARPAKATAAAGSAAPTPAPAEKPRIELEERVDRARSAVAELTAEVARLEEAFYAADDPDYRDRVVVKAFNQAREQLETARQELAAAREALDKIEPQSPGPNS